MPFTRSVVRRAPNTIITAEEEEAEEKQFPPSRKRKETPREEEEEEESTPSPSGAGLVITPTKRARSTPEEEGEEQEEEEIPCAQRMMDTQELNALADWTQIPTSPPPPSTVSSTFSSPTQAKSTQPSSQLHVNRSRQLFNALQHAIAYRAGCLECKCTNYKLNCILPGRTNALHCTHCTVDTGQRRRHYILDRTGSPFMLPVTLQQRQYGCTQVVDPEHLAETVGPFSDKVPLRDGWRFCMLCHRVQEAENTLRFRPKPSGGQSEASTFVGGTHLYQAPPTPPPRCRTQSVGVHLSRHRARLQREMTSWRDEPSQLAIVETTSDVPEQEEEEEAAEVDRFEVDAQQLAGAFDYDDESLLDAYCVACVATCLLRLVEQCHSTHTLLDANSKHLEYMQEYVNPPGDTQAVEAFERKVQEAQKTVLEMRQVLHVRQQHAAQFAKGLELFTRKLARHGGVALRRYFADATQLHAYERTWKSSPAPEESAASQEKEQFWRMHVDVKEHCERALKAHRDLLEQFPAPTL